MSHLPKKPIGVWYKNYESWIQLADTYHQKCLASLNNPAILAELKNAERFLRMRLVFESNLLEKAGLPEGEIRKLNRRLFPGNPRYSVNLRGVDYA